MGRSVLALPSEVKNGNHPEWGTYNMAECVPSGSIFVERLRKLYHTKWLPWAIIVFGTVIRLVEYAHNRSLWLDEAMLANNIVTRGYAELATPLAHNQEAPLGFLWLERLAINTFGNSEYALRLAPLLAGIIALGLVYPLTRKAMGENVAPLALFLVAVSGPLVRYSAEVKQYSGDVLAAVLLTLLAWRTLEKGLSWGSSLLLATAGAVALWFSHASILVLAGVGAVLLVEVIRTGAKRQLPQLLCIWVLWLGGFVVAYTTFLSDTAGNASMVDYWQDGFMPLLLRSREDVLWFVEVLFRVLRDPAGFELAGLAAVALVIGAQRGIAERPRATWLLLTPIAAALLASGLHRYPFSGRLILFIVPALMVLVAYGLVHVLRRLWVWRPSAALVFLAILVLHPCMMAGNHLFRPRVQEEIRPVLEYVKAHREPGDLLYLYYSSDSAARYYGSMDPEVNAEPVLVGSGWDLSAWARDAVTMKHFTRSWIVVAHFGNPDFVRFLKLCSAHELDHYAGMGAEAYLLDLRNLNLDVARGAIAAQKGTSEGGLENMTAPAP